MMQKFEGVPHISATYYMVYLSLGRIRCVTPAIQCLTCLKGELAVSAIYKMNVDHLSAIGAEGVSYTCSIKRETCGNGGQQIQ